MELLYWFKPVFAKDFGKNPCKTQKIILCEVRFNPCEVRLNITNPPQKIIKAQKSGILKFCQFKSSKFSNVQFNFTSQSCISPYVKSLDILYAKMRDDEPLMLSFTPCYFLAFSQNENCSVNFYCCHISLTNI